MSSDPRAARTPLHSGDAAAFLLLRLGVGAVLVWFGAAELHDPGSWSVFFPHGLDAIRAPAMLLHATLLLATGTLLMLGLLQRAAAALASLLLLGVLGALVWNGAIDSVFVRDIGLAAASLALAVSGSAALAPGLDRALARSDGRARRWAALSTAAVVACAVLVLVATAVPESASMAQLGGVGGGSPFGGASAAGAPSGALPAATAPAAAAPVPATSAAPAGGTTSAAGGEAAGAEGVGEDGGPQAGPTAGGASTVAPLGASTDVDVGGEDSLGASAPGSNLSGAGTSGAAGSEDSDR